MPGPKTDTAQSRAPCTRCGAIVPGGTAGCLKLFHDVLALEYSDPAYGAVHLLTVDAYALQHSEDHGPRSNAFHLIRLCMMLEYGDDTQIGHGSRWWQSSVGGKREIPYLESPVDRGELTIADVHGAASPEEHAERVRRWARSVWDTWSNHHEWARQWLREK